MSEFLYLQPEVQGTDDLPAADESAEVTSLDNKRRTFTDKSRIVELTGNWTDL